MWTTCAEPGCPRLVRRGRCDEHRLPRQSRSGKSPTFYNMDSGWQRIPTLAIQRDKACKMCGSKEHLAVHLPPEYSGDHSRVPFDEVVTLCRRCHGRIASPRARRTGGQKISRHAGLAAVQQSNAREIFASRKDFGLLDGV